MYDSTCDLNEVIHYERLDADMLQASYEAEGRAAWARQQRVDALLAEGETEAACSLCDHGHVGLLAGSCSDRDPRYGEDGYRCYDCGAVVTDLGGEVVHTA